MNWKVLGLIAGLILTASVSACSSSTPDSQNQVNPGASPGAESATPGDAMKSNKSGDAMKSNKSGDAMKSNKSGDAMKNDKSGDAMKKEPATTKP